MDTRRVRYASERREGEARREHIERVVEQFAGPAFWTEVGKAFPQVRSGDFGPDETIRITSAMENAISTWLLWNEPAPTHDQLTTVGDLMHSAANGGYGMTQDVTGRLVGRDLNVPSPAQAECKLEPDDFLLILRVTWDGAEYTGVTIIDREGQVKANYEVQ